MCGPMMQLCSALSAVLQWSVLCRPAPPLTTRVVCPLDTCREGIFVRVLGHTRTFSQQRSVVGFLIQPLKDFNEITYHMVHVAHSQLALKKSTPVVRGGAGRGEGQEGGSGGEGGQGGFGSGAEEREEREERVKVKEAEGGDRKQVTMERR